MIYQSNIELEAKKARAKFEHLVKSGKAFELTEKRLNRTAKQNRALHKFFTMIAQELNDLGLEFTYDGLSVDSISLMYTPELVKQFLWRPIQSALYGTKSTTELKRDDFDKIIDVITKFFGERGIYIEFPYKEALLNDIEEKKEG